MIQSCDFFVEFATWGISLRAHPPCPPCPPSVLDMGARNIFWGLFPFCFLIKMPPPLCPPVSRKTLLVSTTMHPRFKVRTSPRTRAGSRPPFAAWVAPLAATERAYPHVSEVDVQALNLGYKVIKNKGRRRSVSGFE